MTNKFMCSKCSILKDISEFYKGRIYKSWGICKECDKERRKENYKLNRDKRIQYSLDYYRNNIEEERQKRKEYYAVNSETISQQNKIHYEQHKDEYIERAANWVAKNPEARKAVIQRYVSNSKDKIKASASRRRAREQNALGEFTSQEWEDLKAKYDYTCLSCNRKEPEVLLSPDHIVPLARGGTNYIDNIQPLCIKINGSRKGNCQNKKGTKTTDYRNLWLLA